MGYKELFAPIDQLTGEKKKPSKPSDADKWKYTLCTTFLFMLISSPVLYIFTSKLTGLELATSQGAPTPIGLWVHSLVFTLILRAMMG